MIKRSKWCTAALLSIWQTAACAEAEKPVRNDAPGVLTVNAVRWEAGQRYRYATDLKSKLSAAGQPLLGFSLSAELALEARPSGDETNFLVDLENVTLSGDRPDSQGQFAALARELSIPFGFSTLGGKLSSVSLPSDWSAFAASIARTLVAGLQFVERPADQRADAWTASEIDATGTYTAEYVATTHGGALKKRKLRYESIPLGKLGMPEHTGEVSPEVVESKGSLLLGDAPGDPRVERAEYSEKLRIPLSPTSLVSSETELVLAFVRKETPTVVIDWATALASTQRQAPSDARASRGTTVDYDPQRIGSYTFEKAVLELEQQVPDGNDGHNHKRSLPGDSLDTEDLEQRKSKFAAQGRVFSALAALIRRDAQNVEKVVARIRGGSSAQRALLDALSSAGSPEAQDALISLMSDAKGSRGLRSAAAFSLTRTGSATSGAVTALQRHLGESDALRVPALLGLGTIARRLREAGEGARAEAIASRLVEELRDATVPARKVEVLRAIANSGSASALPAVKPLLGDKIAKVHAAALEAMRLMAHPEVDPILAHALTDPDQTVQTAAVEAIAVREVSPLLRSAVERASGATFSTAIRVKAVRIMGRWLVKHPELRETLEQLARADAPAVREAAQKALGA